MKVTTFKKILFIGFFILCYNLAQAGIIPYNSRIYTASPGAPVTIGLPTATTFIQVTPPWTGSFMDAAVMNRITFGVDHQNMTYVTLAGEVKVRLKLEEWAVGNTSATPSTTTFQELVINYQPFGNTIPYIDKSVFSFNDAYKFQITIDDIVQNGTSITTLPSNLFIDADILVERYEDFSTNSSVPITVNPIAPANIHDLNCDGIYDEIELTWMPILGAEEYQLEWTFVNDYGVVLGPPYLSSSTLKYDFKNNSTRISKTDNSHKITLTFEHGYLLYRVRGIGRDLTDPTKNIVGVWSHAADNGFASSVPSQYHNTQEHESEKNWQYSATYAEEGKKKEVISYFDGSLRNRQSVTKVNSDNNTIVGETVYDYQGRPAINVLPVPVNDPTCTNQTPLKFYPNFNRDDSTAFHSYGRDDFDRDGTIPCVAPTGAMSTNSGASNYYSPANPKKADQQAFVPDGKKFPFTQIEYTPDNTGRIRRQGGVGPEYQLGEDHETKYFYGFPNQIQLDRLFGSEVGDAGHYKKNVVVDANGQVSVSYMDQEGRTIATSLAGNSPKAADNITTILAPLGSQASAETELEIDLFAKNALGQSSVNTKNIAANAIVFNSQLLAAYESEYDFNYLLNVEQLVDPCLRENICFSCVYDLEIKVTDDCGQAVAPISGSHPVFKTVGHFTADGSGNVVSFNLDCTAPVPFTQTESFKLNLPVGNYTVSKILTVNAAARDFYVTTYIDSVYNSCVNTLHDFIAEELANIDTADCNIDCATCEASMMTVDGVLYTDVADARDAYVAAGKGTELEFDYLLEECGAPCKTITWCEATYQQLLMDVSPDGQYAQFQTTIGGAAPDLQLSVLNTSNSLPKSNAGIAAHWQNPKIDVNGTTYSQYLEEDGTRSTIHLSPNGSGGYIPAVVSTSASLVKLDAVGGFYYTYPENLANVQDFVSNWTENWAKSLVQYHPEYCYYEKCKEYDKVQSGDTKSSDELDELLLKTSTYQAAVAAGLILADYSTTAPPPANTDIRQMARFVYSGSSVSDPFLFNSSAYTIYGPILSNSVNNFKVLGSGFYSMVEVAAITARCGTTYGTTPVSATCRSFGKDFGTDPIENDKIRDTEWNFLRNFYLSEKHRVQQKRADDYAKIPCSGYNGCIGNSDYNAYLSGMVGFTSGSAYFGSQYLNNDQPCSIFFKDLYKSKVKRFIGPDDIHSPSPDEMDYQMYLQTGQCPLAIDYQYLISKLASNDQLDNTVGEDLQTYGEFTNDLYLEISGGATTSFVPYVWKATSAVGDVLSGNFENTLTSTPVCSFVLDKTGAGIVNWDDIVSISQLDYTATVGGNYEFNAIAAISTSGVISYKTITGSTCVKITGCTFPPQCDANDLAKDLSSLMSALQIHNQLTSTSAVVLNGTPSQYQLFITPSIKNALGTTSIALRWKYNSVANQYELYDVAAPTKVLVIKFTAFTPSTFNNTNLFASNVRSFNGVQSNYQNFFIIQGADATNTNLVTIDGSIEFVDGAIHTGVSMGSCGLPEPIGCQDNENQVRADLEALLMDVLLKRPFTGNINLTTSPFYTSLIQSYFPEDLASTSSINPHSFDGDNYTDSLIFTIHSEKGDCNMLLYHSGEKIPRYFGDLVGFASDLTPYGSTAPDNNYYQFYIVGIYSVGGRSFMDTIWGESCLPLQICTPCLEGAEPSCVSCKEVKIFPPASVCKNQPAVFSFEALGCNGSPELLWNYGDGTVSSLATHTYTSTGTYTVTLSTVRTAECHGVPTLVAMVEIIVTDCGTMPPVPKEKIYFNRLDSIALANGILMKDSTLNSYTKYSANLDTLNIDNGWNPTDTAYVVAEDYSNFYAEGYKHSLNTYSEFIANYDNTIDSKNHLRNVDAFIVDYGPYTNCKKEYNRYVQAITKYNSRAIALSVPTITAVNDSVFNNNIMCDSIKKYIAYLKPFPNNGLTPLSEMAFFASRSSLPPPTDPCVVLYKQYVAAYNTFEEAQQINNTCKEYQTVSPLYSYEEFVKHELCSSEIALFNSYINLLNSGSACPGSMPKAGSVTAVDEKTCERLYAKYQAVIDAYNSSAYAVAHSHTISALYTSYALFEKAELCNCVSAYINYLSPYIEEPGASTLPLPVDIDHFADCEIPANQPVDSCKYAYENYLMAIADYNEYVKAHPELSLPPIEDIYKDISFTAEGFCYCVDAYVAFLQTIINGTADLSKENRTELYLQLDIANTCTETITPPCDPAMPQDTVLSPPYVPYTNPCVQYQIDLAYANAENSYNQYVDSLTTWISALYNQHCLGAFESFTTKYNDKEYHFTLYYYDQAGNLVRTIPPQGVVVNDMQNTSDADYQQINSDRTFNQHTFFTDHTMATTYEYNSLNQLVRQSMPDHDLMKIWDFTLPNGLDSRLKVTATQFVNSTKGYLSGYVDVAGSPAYKRGYLYTTNNGGVTWTKMDDVVASDLKKVQMIDATNGYAVGSNGIILKTIDGGTTWDMKQLYDAGVVTFSDLYFVAGSSGVIVSESGIVLKTIDGGVTYVDASGGTLPTTLNYSSITYDGTCFYLSGNDASGLNAQLFKGTISGSPLSLNISWAQMNSMRTTDLTKIQMVSALKGFAVGIDGTLVSTIDGGVTWKTIATGTSDNFRDVYFNPTVSTLTDGVAIIDSVPGFGLIYKTTNGGATWTLLSGHTGIYYNSFNFYQADKGYAVGTKGKIRRVVMSSIFGLVPIPTTGITLPFDIAAANFSDKDKGWVVGNNGTVYFTTNANSITPTWNSVSTGTSGSSANFKDIYFGVIGSGTNNNGILLGVDGKSYRISPSGSTYTIVQINASQNFVDIDDSPNNVFAYDKTSSGQMYSIAKTSIASGTFSPLANAGTPLDVPNPLNLNSIFAIDDNDVIIVGKSGDIHTGNESGAAMLWTTHSQTNTPLALNDIQAAGVNTVYAVGKEGTLLQTINGADWITLPTKTVTKFNAIKFNTSNSATTAGTTGLIAGDNGQLYKNFIIGSFAILAPIAVSTSNNLYDIALNTSDKAYVSGANGTLVSIPTIVTPVATIASLQPVESFRGIDFKFGTSQIYTVGDNSAVYSYNSTSGAKIKSVFTPGLNDVNFTSVLNGYTVGEKDIVRHTADGGITWKYLKPINSSGVLGSIPELNGVWTNSNDKAIIIGNAGYVGKVAGTTITYYSIGTSNTLYDVAVKSGTGYIVGQNGVAFKTINDGSTFTAMPIPPSTNTLRAVHLFQDKTMIAVGNAKSIYYFNGTAWVIHSEATIPSTINFTDVFFHDDRSGYVAGSGGVGVGSYVLRCALEANIQTYTGGTTNSWVPQSLTGINGVANPTTVDVVTIDFATRTHGFLGGKFNTGSPINYARLINDETDMFSTRFWYDRLGRMVVSQNTKQYNRKNSSTPLELADYSYTLYDLLGRISEVGEVSDNAGATTNFSTIFGEYVNGLFNSNVINDTKLNAWITASGRREVTKTYYDENAITGLPITQDNLRKRVASVTYEDVFDNDDQTFQHATHYTYDIHGNVKTLLQDNKKLYDIGVANSSLSIQAQRYKRVDYDYDLISGKVNLVRFQDGQPDAFYHFYAYDADNRITDVYTSRYPQANTLINWNVVINNTLWDLDAHYIYYAHGPLARVEYGGIDNKVQGTDYAYTLQGWIKGVNSNVLKSENDIGGDGLTASVNSMVGKDAFSYTLNYHANDYEPIDGLKWSPVTQRFEAVTANSDLNAERYDLFNGNISSMVTTIEEPKVYTSAANEFPTVLPQGTAYKYDQLNRILEMKAFQNLTVSANAWDLGSTYDDKYHNQFTYDANGNILTQLRASANGTIIDNLSYNYVEDALGRTKQNRLYHVNDVTSPTAYTDDIDDQGTFNPNPLTVNDGVSNNYMYDEIGNLSRDKQEDIDKIEWTVYGKIKSITREAGSLKSDLEFNYDASGNRIAKIEKPRTAGGVEPPSEWKTTYYARDAQGNVMSIYKLAPVSLGTSFKVIERNLFGSSRLGSDYTEVELVSTLPTPNPFVRTLGNKHYEGSNHLGNVLAIFSDRKIPRDDNSDLTIDYFQPDLLSSNDYSPFGTILDGRTYGILGRVGFNNKENDDEIKGVGNSQDYGMRIYDNRLGRFLSLDPQSEKNPFASPYSFAGNSPIYMIDIGGEFPTPSFLDLLTSNLKLQSNFSKLLGKTTAIAANGKVAAGAAALFGIELKGGVSLTADPKGNLALNFTTGGFLTVGTAGVMNKTIETGNFYLGGNVGVSAGFDIYSVQDVKELSGLGYSFDLDISLIAKIDFDVSMSSNKDVYGVGASVGVGAGAGFGILETNTKTFAFGVQDIDNFNKNLVSVYKDLQNVNYKNIVVSKTQVPSKDGKSYTDSFVVVGENKKTGKTETINTYVNYTATKVNENYTETTNVKHEK